ncbi:tetratricopeptide repeat protein [Limihaloglobus sulfuriphilus]|nr:tetratricopeptide repeat protein [Limihaloglobus sulfuriphilus]
MELNIWNDQEFRRRFTQSYIAETDIEPTVTSDEREELLEIMQLISDDNVLQAEKVLKEALEDNEAATAVFDFTLANIYFQAEELDEAALYYEKAVSKYDKFRRAWRNLALIHVRKADYTEAVDSLTRVIELGGGDAVTYGLLGFSYSSIENSISAESAYRMAIMLDPLTLDWKMGLARSFFKQERFSEAAALCGLLIRENPENTDLWLLKANAYIGLAKPMEAAQAFEIVRQFGGSTADTLNLLGDIYINEGLFGLAADLYIEAMELDPDSSLERALRAAKALTARSQFDHTARLLDAVNTTYADNMDQETKIDVLKLSARLAVASGSGDDREAEILEKIVELDPLDGEALILLGQHSARKENPDKAIFYYEQAAGIEGFEAEAMVRHAQLLVRLGKYSEALPLLRRAQKIKYRDNIQEYLEQVERVAKSK